MRGTVYREHLISRLDRVSGARLRLVVAPAGSGKTILLRQLAARTANQPGLVNVWCTANSAEVSATSFVRRLAGCFAPALGQQATRISHLDTLIARIAQCDEEFVVYLDDVHRLNGRQAATVLGQLVQAAPPNLRFVLASRSERIPAATRLADGEPTYRIGYRELQFRTWDVERLFREVYRSPLAPEAAATLCERVEGWPVALSLFNMDTALLGDAEREAAVADPLGASGRIQGYLAKEVLDQLPMHARDFMVDASALGVLEGRLCDTALNRSGSGPLLAWLEDNQALTFSNGRSYRFHLLLQRFLEQRMAELRGPHLTRQAYHRAAVQLSASGHWAEAYRCYARCEDWVATSAILHRFSAHRSGLPASASVPAALLDSDPWIALAEARRLRGEGRLAQAYDRYLAAEDHLPDPRLRWQCSIERSAIARWIGTGYTVDSACYAEADPLVDDISGYLRQAVASHPAKLLTRPVPAANPGWSLGRAIAAMLDGRPELAAELVAPLETSSSPFLAVSSKLITALLDACAHGRGNAARFDALALQAEASGWLWLARVARGATALVDPDGCGDAAAVLEQCREVGDDWGTLLTASLLAVGYVRAGRDARPALHDAIELANRLGAQVLGTWLQFVLVDELERRNDPLAGVERAQLEWLLAQTVLDRAATHGAELLTGLRSPVAGGPGLTLAPQPIEPDPPVQVRCFGRYELLVDGKEVDLGPLRAQARRVLRVLSMYHGQPLHEERLVAALWPDAPLKQAKHRLQVAISSLRALLRKHLPDDGFGVVRHGNAYLLRFPAGSTVDVVDFADALREWRQSRNSGDRAAVAAAGHRVLDLYRGELLSEEGPVEWVLARREAVRGEAAGVAVALARLELDRGNPAIAIEVCERALMIDELDHQLWSLLVDARRRTGSVEAARRTQQAYLDLLAEG
jgi:DNA-binding SARP family transcriptional activator